MANVLDLRRRIRSVKNTRQITKAMKMVSAAKLRRAQERALAARPYAKMITSVLESLTRRVDIFDERPATCAIRSLPRAREKRVLLIVISGDKGFAGAFNANILKTAFQFISGNPDKEIDIEAVGRKGRDQMRRRYPAAVYTEQTDERAATKRQVRERKAPVEVTGDHPGMLLKLETSRVFELAQSIISRYVHEEIDAAYIVYNEFKSVIAQRLVVEKLLPHEDRHSADYRRRGAHRRRARARRRGRALAGIELEPVDTARPTRKRAEVRHRAGGLHLRAAGRGAVQRPAPAICFFHAVSRHDGVGGRRTRGPHDGHGFGNQQRLGHDRRAHAAHESRAPGGHHQGDHRDCFRRSGALVKEAAV
jgi:F-type H+-transporting ATPase subunit gamma